MNFIKIDMVMCDLIQSYNDGRLKTSVTNDKFYVNVLKNLPLKQYLDREEYVHPFDDLFHIYDDHRLYKFSVISVCHAMTNIVDDQMTFVIESENGEKINFYV